MSYPVIFIPGLFGSLGDDVIKGTGEFSFGFAEKIYKPFIEVLKSLDYVEGESLFISYYDWKRSVLESVERYLHPNIEKIKKQTGTNKVIIIGHSLGGLLGRAYMTYFSPSNVDKLIMIGTPNLGSINAYYFWSGGKLPYSKIEDNILYNGIKLGFILYYRFFHNLNYLKVLRNIFPVARDLLPSYGYGNYLYFKENGIQREIPIENMTINNLFLNMLNKETMGQENLYIISGKGIYTNKQFEVDIKNIRKTKWLDGKPMMAYKTNYGDGTVTTFSTLGNLEGNNITIKGNHTNILYKSQDYLANILGRPITKKVEEETVEKIYLILAKDCHELNIITSNNNEISSKSINIMDNRVQAINLRNNNFWIMVAGDNDLDLNIELEYTRKIKPKIYNTVISR